MPIGVMIFEEGVCQSYAAVFNQLLSKVGIKSYIVQSDVHSWNMVKIGDKYYYIDVTFDDPLQKPGTGLYAKDYVSYDYFLTNIKDNDSEHILCDQYQEIFASVLTNSDDAYKKYYPKANNISAINYIDGSWYFVVRTSDAAKCGVYKWDGKWDGTSNQVASELDIKSSTIKSMAEFEGKLYVCDASGLAYYDLETKEKTIVEGTENVEKVYSSGVVLYLLKSGSTEWEAYEKSAYYVNKSEYDADTNVKVLGTQNSSTASTSANDSSNESVVIKTISTSSKIKKPAKVKKVKAKNKKGKKIRVSWKKVKGAKGYQVKYALNKKFTKKKKTKLVKKTKVTLKKLKKKKKYYIKVRAYKLNGKKKVYGKWSKIVKVKVKK